MNRALLEVGFEDRDRPAVVALLREYETDIGMSLCFQGFDAELAGLPGQYAPPRGSMILARDAREGTLVGCVAVRPAPQAGMCEMKRLYVRAAHRGTALGRTLAQAAIDEARRLGYQRMCLDTLPGMVAAQTLYRSLGFRQIGVSASRPRVLLFERDLLEARC